MARIVRPSLAIRCVQCKELFEVAELENGKQQEEQAHKCTT